MTRPFGGILLARTFTASLVTPEKAILEAEVVYADVPAHDGQIGFLVDRAPIVFQLGAGVLRLEMPAGGDRKYRIDGGFAQMNRNRLTILCEKAQAMSGVESHVA